MADETSTQRTAEKSTGPRITRRRLVVAAGGGVVAASGAGVLYRALAAQSTPPVRRYGPPKGGYPIGQYEVADYGVRVQPDPDSAVMTLIPPTWNLVLTGTLAHPPRLADQQRLEAALQAVEVAYPYSPSGVFALVAYGLPYFRRYIPQSTFEAHLPHMVDADAAPVVLDAQRFASDPPALLLEANEIAFHLRSDSLDQLHDVQHALFGKSSTLAGAPAPTADIADLVHITSVRSGFVGAGLPRSMAQQAKLSVAAQIPETSPLFMGFTSAQQQGQATEPAVSYDGKRDPLLQPLTTAHPGDYFAGGTSMHLSHLIEDLDQWYALSYEERAGRMFHYNAAATLGRVTVQTLWLNPNTTVIDAEQNHLIGHNEAVQRGSRSPQGQALQLRVDFNTMDALDSDTPAPGVHFVSFSAGTQIFNQSRKGMDASDVAPGYQVAPHANGINAFIRATRRQNFLVPPRAHRAFPLLEIPGVR